MSFSNLLGGSSSHANQSSIDGSAKTEDQQNHNIRDSEQHRNFSGESSSFDRTVNEYWNRAEESSAQKPHIRETAGPDSDGLEVYGQVAQGPDTHSAEVYKTEVCKDEVQEDSSIQTADTSVAQAVSNYDAPIVSNVATPVTPTETMADETRFAGLGSPVAQHSETPSVSSDPVQAPEEQSAMPKDVSSSEANSEDLNASDKRGRNRRLTGYVIQCDATNATVAVKVPENASVDDQFWSIGKLVSISTGKSRVIGMVGNVRSADNSWIVGQDNVLNLDVELAGEIVDKDDGSSSFNQGIASFPPVGSQVHQIRSNDLSCMYCKTGDEAVNIGNLSQDSSVDASISMHDTLRMHFAVVGTTGVGKSSSVSLLLRKAVENKPKLKIIVLDPHNEYENAFSRNAISSDLDKMQLPFWMLQFDELVEVLYRGNPQIREEVDALRDLIPQAKAKFNDKPDLTGGSIRRKGAGKTYAVDTPVPYKLADLLKMIDDQSGLLDGSHDKIALKSLKKRILLVSGDSRYSFMFGQRTVEDKMEQVLADIFRVNDPHHAISLIQLSGIPSEIVNVVVSVLSRLMFDLAVLGQGQYELLLMCEEAHRYVPCDSDSGFGPTRFSLARIAKEGRKYGAYLGIVTQRPSELDSTILSQCSTVFAMRLSNMEDQRIMGTAISNGSASTIKFLSSLGNGEAIAFGAGVSTPMRMQFEYIPQDQLPGKFDSTDETGEIIEASVITLKSIVKRMRSSSESSGETEEAVQITEVPSKPQFEPQLYSPAQPHNRANGVHGIAQGQGNNGMLRRS